MAGKWFLERTFPVPQHLAELYGSTEWFLKRTFFVPQDSERLQKLQVFRTLRSTTNDEPKTTEVSMCNIICIDIRTPITPMYINNPSRGKVYFYGSYRMLKL